MFGPAQSVTVLTHRIEGPINLGALCRAMANTGFRNLRFSGHLEATDPDARRFAVHAGNVLDGAQKCDSFANLIEGFDRLYGFSPREPWPEGRVLDLDGFLGRFEADTEAGMSVGLLFGNEAHGLENRHLAYCDAYVALPTSSEFPSLNLAQAVLVVLWELRRRHKSANPTPACCRKVAGPEKKAVLLDNIRGFMDDFELLNPQNPEHIWQEVAPIFKTRDWGPRELELLHVLFNKARARYTALKKKAPEP